MPDDPDLLDDTFFKLLKEYRKARYDDPTESGLAAYLRDHIRDNYETDPIDYL